VIQGHHHDLVFRGNTIGYTKPASGATAGIRVSANAPGLRVENNEFPNVGRVVEAQK
jgi:hypothetical protein